MIFHDTSGVRKIIILAGTFLVLLLSVTLAIMSLTHVRTAAAHAPVQYEHPDPASDRLTKTIVLTFDDGPEPEHTEDLLEVLRAENVPATFFLLGENVVHYPELARKIAESGFEVGNHTFTHAPEVHESELRLRRELLATDRVIRKTTGLETLLYRPPFLLDIDLGEVDGARVDKEPLRWAEEAGYLVVGANIDSRDWETPEGDSHSIVEQLLAQVHEGGNVVLLHDHGGSGATVEAVREFIPLMKERGYRFISTAEHFNVSPGQFVRPAEPLGVLDGVVIGGVKAFVLGFSWIEVTILLVTALAISRMWLILLVRKGYVPFAALPPVPWRRRAISVLIPAYNEAANIEATLRSVLRELGARDETIVVDDGSEDETAAIVERMKDEFGGRLMLLRKENGGTKGAALAHALKHATRGILVCIDADTIIGPQSLDNLARHFDDTRVGAVAGKVYPAKRASVLAAFQYLEYIQGQNLDKEVFSALQATGIVPGAIGAWRRKAVVRVGGYSTDTVVEDQDLTLALLSDGWRVIYDREATAYTETPASIRGFFRQRSRWIFGTMQCAWKYRRFLCSVKRPSLGWLVLPNILLFNIILPLLVPLIDGVLIAGLFGPLNLTPLLVPVLAYIAFDMWYTFEALNYERKPPLRLVALILWQRWFYRYTMALVTFRGIAYALQGYLMRWGSHQRRGDCHSALENLAPAPSLISSPIRVIPPITSAS